MKILLLITVFAAICLGIEVATEAETMILPAFLRNKQLRAAAKNEAYYRKPTQRRRRSRSGRSRRRRSSDDEEDEDDERDARREAEREKALEREREERERKEKER